MKSTQLVSMRFRMQTQTSKGFMLFNYDATLPCQQIIQYSKTWTPPFVIPHVVTNLSFWPNSPFWVDADAVLNDLGWHRLKWGQICCGNTPPHCLSGSGKHRCVPHSWLLSVSTGTVPLSSHQNPRWLRTWHPPHRSIAGGRELVTEHSPTTTAFAWSWTYVTFPHILSDWEDHITLTSLCGTSHMLWWRGSWAVYK